MKSIGMKELAWAARATAAAILTVALCCARDNPLDAKGTNYHPLLSNEASAAPVLVNPGNQTVAVRKTLRLTLSASGAESDSLRFSMSPALPGAHLEGAVFRWTPARNQDGVYRLTFFVKDVATPGLSDSQAISITVTKEL